MDNTPDNTSEEESPQKTAENLLAELDAAIASGPWDDSTLLKATRKELQKIRARFAEDVGLELPPELDAPENTEAVAPTPETSAPVNSDNESNPDVSFESTAVPVAAPETNAFADSTRLHPQEAPSREVFISLYCADGANLKRWQLLLSTVESQVSNRPVYGSETDIMEALRSRQNPTNEGYVVIRVNPDNVSDMGVKDRQGHPLVQLKERSVFSQNVIKFVHATGEYRLRDGALQKTGEAQK